MNLLVSITATAALLSAAACGRDPSPYPRLLPTDQILAEPTLPAHAAPAAQGPTAVEAAAQASADVLHRRAKALQRPVIEPELRARMGL